MKKLVSFLKKSILFENPVLMLLLGLCPLLAVTTRLSDGAIFGGAAFFVLIVSTLLISAVKNIIPKSVRDIVYIVIVAFVVGICEILLGAFLPIITSRIGIYLPLITTSGIILSRSEKFESEKKLSEAMLSGLTIGVGYFALALSLSFVRELLGRGSLLGFQLIPADYAIGVVVSPAGGFFLFGILVAIFGKFLAKTADKEGER